MKTSRRLSIVGLLCLAGAISACDSESGSVTDTENDWPGEVTTDVDTSADTTGDIATDATADTPADSAAETTDDRVADTPADNTTDTAADTPADSANDTAADTPPDSANDTAADTPPPEVDIVAAGWSFGSCIGTCVGHLAVEGDSITYEIEERDGTVHFSYSGTLTPAGLAMVEEAVADLDPATLEEVYGCPDCADGGEASVTLRSDGDDTQHSYEFGNPPEVLAAIDTMVFNWMHAMESCESNEFITVNTPCTPFSEVMPEMYGLLGGGYWFGECWGACRGDLVVNVSELTLILTGWDDTSFLNNSGELTDLGLTTSAALVGELADVELQSVYGCPDCADGGGFYVTIRRDDLESRHEYNFGGPPDVLDDLDEFVRGLIDALTTCTVTPHVVPGEGCVPFEP